MAKIKFTKNPGVDPFNIGGHFAGDVAEVADDLAKDLMAAGYAVPDDGTTAEPKSKKGK